MNRMQRITLAKAGRRNQRYVLVAPPWADVGDFVRINGEHWRVVKVQETRGAVLAKKAAS